MSLHRVLPVPLALSNTHLAQRWSASTDAFEDAKIMTRRKIPIVDSREIHQVQTPPRQQASPSREPCRDSVSPDRESLEDYEQSVTSVATPSNHRKREGTPCDRSDSFIPEGSPSSICLCQPDPKVPRPRNAFILYRQHHQASVVSQNPGLANPQISKVIGDHWRNAPDEVKNHWRLLAEEEKARHQKQHPGYRYQPRKSNRANSISSSLPFSESSELPLVRCAKCGGRSISTSTMMSTVSSSHAPSNLHTGRASQSAYHAQHSPSRMSTSISGPLSSSSTASRYFRGTVSPVGAQQNGHPPSGLRYLPQKSLSLASPHYKRSMVREPDRQDHVGLSQHSPEVKRRRTNNNVAFVPVRGPSGPLSPLAVTPHGYHSRRQSLPRLDSLGPSLHSPFTMAPPPRQHQHSRPEKSLTLAPLKQGPVSVATGVVPNGGAPETATPTVDSQAKSLEAMILSIPILNKIKVLARISGPLSTVSSPSTSPANANTCQSPSRRGLVIAIDAADPGALKQLTQALAKSLRDDCDVKVFRIPPDTSNERTRPSFQSYLKLVDQYHALSQKIAEHVTIRALVPHDESLHNRAPTPQAGEKGRQTSESPVSPKSFPREDPVTNSTAAHHNLPRQNMDGRSMSGTLATQSQPEDIVLTDAPATDCHHESDGEEPPQPSSPSPLPIPIALLPSWQLTHTDAFACNVDITDRYSPVDHWQWGATVWRGVIGADVTVAVKADVGDESPSKTGSGVPAATATATAPAAGTDGTGAEQHGAEKSIKIPASTAGSTGNAHSNIGVEVRLDDARAVIVRGDPDGAVPEGSLRRVGFEVGEWVRGWVDREEMKRRGSRGVGG